MAPKPPPSFSPTDTTAKDDKKKKKKKPRQIWLKRVLIPFWTVQLLFMLILIGLNAYTVVDSYPPIPASTILLLTFSSFNTFLLIIEIILFCQRKLQPLLYLIFQTLKTTLWVALFCMSVVGLARNGAALRASNGVVLYLFTGLVEVIVVL
ncbi:MAG: hypothetical protein Q9222_005490, partial [Ikaeria aurantiellina]